MKKLGNYYCRDKVSKWNFNYEIINKKFITSPKVKDYTFQKMRSMSLLELEKKAEEHKFRRKIMREYVANPKLCQRFFCLWECD